MVKSNIGLIAQSIMSQLIEINLVTVELLKLRVNGGHVPIISYISRPRS